jgi:hypothetical protein
VTKRVKISSLNFDNKNINKGSEFGTSLLEKSIRETGLGRSVLVDKNNILIAGNKTVETASQLGFEDAVIVETRGKELIVVKRTDLDINTSMGLKAKILDNTVNKHNYREDVEMVAVVVEEAEIMNISEYGLSSKDVEKGSDVAFQAGLSIKIKVSTQEELEWCLKDINYLMKQKYPNATVTHS